MQAAITAWRRLLGDCQVLSGPDIERDYQVSTTGVRRTIPAVLRPQNAQQVIDLVRVANESRIPLYAVSTGHNWGYGSANPVVDGCVVVDLSGMRQILDFDPEAGLVTIEPGVTQQQLWDFLNDRGARFFVPVHGGGPDCSVLGNALERGYGITPHADHFAALTDVEAVLPNGDVYRSALSELGGGHVNRLFKWGLGPYLDGLFTQGNLGIVTQGTFVLAPIPEQTQAFLFAIRAEEDLEEVVVVVRDILRMLGSYGSSINLMNARRVLSMITPYPRERTPAGSAIPQSAIDELTRREGVSCWTGAGALYGNRAILRAARGWIRKRLRPYVQRLVFFDHHDLTRWDSWLSLVPFGMASLRRNLQSARQFLDIVSGKPQRTALPLAYWKSGRQPSVDEPLDPARDGCGLIWYSPLVPMKSKIVRDYCQLVTDVCCRHGLDPLITLTSLSDRVFDSTVPLLFQRDDAEEARRAHACYEALFDEGAALGCVPYRVGVQHMGRFVDTRHACWRLVEQLKGAVDPHDILSPGRYAPTARTSR